MSDSPSDARDLANLSNADSEQEFNQMVGSLLERHRSRIKRLVLLRLSERVRSRVDASDIVQEVMVEAARRFPKYVRERPVALALWLRQITMDRIRMSHRMHVDALRRSVEREQPFLEPNLQAISKSFSKHLADQARSPSSEAMFDELYRRVELLMKDLSETDRELLLLRHFEQLDNQQAAIILNMNPSTCSSRYLRTLKRLRTELAKVPGYQ
ncbi:MAG: sigma-70 family RNA polymerase sigma factor [Planctomycetales bacterium]|nr:sigma-70 family RNA polymerase sigma factor [Planctomycetales bacterium]